LVAGEPYVVDFFSHIDRVREFCKARGIALREAAERCVVLPQPSPELLRQIFERFEAETFGIRAGAANEADVRWRGPFQSGLDAYQSAYARYTFARSVSRRRLVTLLTETLWPAKSSGGCAPQCSHLTCTSRAQLNNTSSTVFGVV